MPITTTLNRIRAHGPCLSGWEKLLAHLGKTKADDKPLPYAIMLGLAAVLTMAAAFALAGRHPRWSLAFTFLTGAFAVQCFLSAIAAIEGR